MADDDLSTNSISGNPGIAFQAHTVNGNVYFNGAPPADDLGRPCAQVAEILFLVVRVLR